MVETSKSISDERNNVELDLRPARYDDALAVRSLLDAAVLAVDGVEDRIRAGDVLVATADDRIVGVVVLDSRADLTRIVGIAVRRRRRASGIGTALVEAASQRGTLTAEFNERVRPFYESLGFKIEPADDPDRCRGVLGRT